MLNVILTSITYPNSNDQFYFRLKMDLETANREEESA
jgi:hypothetical protein